MIKPGDRETVTLISQDGWMDHCSVYVGSKCIDEGRIARLDVSVEPDCLPTVEIELHPRMMFSYVEPSNHGATVSDNCELTHKIALQQRRGLRRVAYLKNRGLNARGLIKFDHLNKRVKLAF